MRFAYFRYALAGLAALTMLSACTREESPDALVDSAKKYMAKHDSSAAIIQLKNVLQKEPNRAEARFLLGTASLQNGDAVAAEKELRRALELKYPEEQVIPPLARSLAALGQYKKLLDEFGGAQLPTAQGQAQLQTAIGQAHLALGNRDKAAMAFAEAIRADGTYTAAQVGQARLALANGKLDEAQSIVDSAVAAASSNHEAWLLKGEILATRGQYDAALNAYRKAIEVNPPYLPSHWAAVSLLIRQNKVEEAGKQLDGAKKISGSHPQTLLLQALLDYRKKNYAAAREAIQKAMRGSTDHLPAVLLAAAIELELKSYAQSERLAQRVLQQVPDQPYARRILIAGHLRSGQAGRAMDALQPILGKIDRDPELLALAGETYMMNGQATQAAAYFAKATALDPENARSKTSLALSHMAKGDMNKALHELEESSAADSGIRADLALIATRMQRKEFDKALAAIDALEKKQPTAPLAHNLRGGALLGKNDLAGARGSFERALEVDPQYFPAAANLATLDLSDKKPEAAVQRYEKLLSKEPNHLQALLALASLRMRTGGTSDQVVGLLKKAIAAHPNEPKPRIALVNYYVTTKDTKKALSASQEAMAVLPSNPEILDAAGRAHQAAGETNQALSIYGRLASLQPGSAYPLIRISEVQSKAKNKEGAAESLKQAMDAEPDSVEAKANAIMLHMNAGRTREALDIARGIQKQRPKDALGYAFEGDIHAQSKNWKEAVKAYRAALNRTPSTQVAMKLHVALVESDSKPAADQFASKWLADHAADRAFRAHIAQFAIAQRDYKSAAQHYRTMLDAKPDDAMVLNNLAYVESKLKDPKAVEHARKAHQLAPKHPGIMDTLGVILLEQGDTAGALDLLRKASAMAPGAPGIRLNLAKALIKAGQKDAARRELEELSKLGSKFSGQAEVAELKRTL